MDCFVCLQANVMFGNISDPNKCVTRSSHILERKDNSISSGTIPFSLDLTNKSMRAEPERGDCDDLCTFTAYL